MNLWSEESQTDLFVAISQLFARYARGVDRRDYDLLRSVFDERGLNNNGLSAGDMDSFIEALKTRHTLVPQSLHVNANILILERDIERREALVESCCVAWTRVLPENAAAGPFYDSPNHSAQTPNARLATVSNRYLDLIVERDGELKILLRNVIFEMAASTEVALDLPFGAGALVGSRGPEDPTHQTLNDLRKLYESSSLASSS